MNICMNSIFDFKKPKDIEKSIFFDAKLHRYTIVCKDISGGPVISADTLEEAEELFNQALNISLAYKNFERFSLQYNISKNHSN